MEDNFNLPEAESIDTAYTIEDLTASENFEAERKFTQDEVNKIISERLAAEKRKSGAALEATLEAVKTEAESTTREALLSEVAVREAAVAERELTAYAKERIAELALPASIIGLVETSSQEKIEMGLKGLESIFREAVREAVSQRLGSKSPVAWENSAFDEKIKRAMGL